MRKERVDTPGPELLNLPKGYIYSQCPARYSQLAGPSWGNTFTAEEAVLMLHNELAKQGTKKNK